MEVGFSQQGVRLGLCPQRQPGWPAGGHRSLAWLPEQSPECDWGQWGHFPTLGGLCMAAVARTVPESLQRGHDFWGPPCLHCY